ncbi:hypothetical protein BDB00DRAFT_764344 [Zychaea mexicana]|uniref:uncharacterized protein n=1 Tax=Zychaea mexicana TaxID=64656 RepID=UPI0022FEF8CE|nr:uncharacterized protein BDB00DRAFT_764344 [Zychaea mexicana]KAI9493051.1 hypothetical protein BDB00DRAFT_764344 [Zychaea mexicana]
MVLVLIYKKGEPNNPANYQLIIPITAKGRLDGKKLVACNTTSAITSMHTLNGIGLNPSGLSQMLASRLYAQFIRPKLEYGLAVTSFPKTQLKALEQAQSTCIRMVYGAHSHSETKVMHHLAKLPSMHERTAILQAKFLRRAHFLPDDALLTCLLPTITTQPGSHWKALTNSPL